MMRFKNILVPYDGSEHADRALDVAGDFLRSNPEARVHVISVTYVALDAADFNPDPPNEDEQYNLLGYEMYEEVFSQEQKAAHRAMVQAASEILPDIEPERVICDTIIRPSAVEGIEDYARPKRRVCSCRSCARSISRSAFPIARWKRDRCVAMVT